MTRKLTSKRTQVLLEVYENNDIDKVGVKLLSNLLAKKCNVKTLYGIESPLKALLILESNIVILQYCIIVILQNL